MAAKKKLIVRTPDQIIDDCEEVIKRMAYCLSVFDKTKEMSAQLLLCNTLVYSRSILELISDDLRKSVGEIRFKPWKVAINKSLKLHETFIASNRNILLHQGKLNIKRKSVTIKLGDKVPESNYFLDLPNQPIEFDKQDVHTICVSIYDTYKAFVKEARKQFA